MDIVYIEKPKSEKQLEHYKKLHKGASNRLKRYHEEYKKLKEKATEINEVDNNKKSEEINDELYLKLNEKISELENVINDKNNEIENLKYEMNDILKRKIKIAEIEQKYNNFNKPKNNNNNIYETMLTMRY
jgi:chromosome segregation ATPase